MYGMVCSGSFVPPPPPPPPVPPLRRAVAMPSSTNYFFPKFAKKQNWRNQKFCTFFENPGRRRMSSPVARFFVPVQCLAWSSCVLRVVCHRHSVTPSSLLSSSLFLHFLLFILTFFFFCLVWLSFSVVKRHLNNHLSHTDSGIMTAVLSCAEPGLEVYDQVRNKHQAK